MRLRILSWNIWIYGNFDQIKDFLKKSDADIIGLQEVKDNDLKFNVIGYLSSLGYQNVFAPRQTDKKTGIRFGPAVFSKCKIESSEAHSLSTENERIAVQTNIRAGNHIISIFNTHLLHAHLRESEIRDSQMDRLLAVLPARNTVVLGDFNALPTGRTIQKINKVLKNTDPSLSPTWSNYPEGCEGCLPKGLISKLDYIFVSKDIKLKSFKVGNSKGSDHLPISIEIEL